MPIPWISLRIEADSEGDAERIARLFLSLYSVSLDTPYRITVYPVYGARD